MLPERLATERLELRPFTPTDSRAIFEYWSSDPNWSRFNRSVPAEYGVADAEKFVAEFIDRDRESQPNWAVMLDGKVIGIASMVFEQGHRIAVIGYGVHGAFRGRGLSGEAVRAVISAAFGCYPSLQKIRAHTDARNLSSMRVLKKLAFSREGILRDNQYVKGEFADEAIYGLLRHEWTPETDRVR